MPPEAAILRQTAAQTRRSNSARSEVVSSATTATRVAGELLDAVDRFLAALDPEGFELGEHAHRVRNRPGPVGVEPDRYLGARVTHGSDPRKVVPGPDLEFDADKTRGTGLVGQCRGPARRLGPDRGIHGDRIGTFSAEQSPDGEALAPAAEVEAGQVDRRERLREQVVRRRPARLERRPGALELGDDPVDADAVIALERRGLAVADEAVVCGQADGHEWPRFDP
jgi:hypothetical protein